jgi:hypothetical protein
VIIHRNINNGWNYQAFDRTLSNTSDSGKYYSLQKPDQTFIRALSYQLMEKQDKDNVISLVRKNGLHTPFLFVIDPDQCQDDLDFSVRACYFDRQAPTITHVILGYYNTTYNLREVM